MIQRIQSIFLFVASGACFGLFGADAADTEAPVAGSELFADGSFTLLDDPVLMVLFALAGIVLLAGIFLFRKRPLQMKMSLAAAVLIVLGAGYGAYLWWKDSAAQSASPDLGVALPIVAVVFSLLARNYIRKDEKLVRSADRLR